MSSSNLVLLVVIEEVTLGVTPVVGDFDTVRFTSESLSGTPGTTESQQLRSDRLSSGQILTSLEIGGDLNFELAKEAVLDKFIESAMLNTWNVQGSQVVDLSIDAIARTITRAAGVWDTTLDVGDIFSTIGFAGSVNNTQCQVLEIVSATVIRVAFNEISGAVVTEVGIGTSYKRADRISIGTVKKSFSIEKSFSDLTTKALIYKGMSVSNMSLNVAYGEILTGAFGFMGTKYLEAGSAPEFITDGRGINAPSTATSMNGSIDMPFVTSSFGGSFELATFCIQSTSISLNNNLQAENCIGLIGAKDFSPGTAQVEVSVNAYLSDENWEAIPNKLQQTPFALGFMVKNADGFYGFYLPAVQVSFGDPASGGANQLISLDMAGQAKVGSSGESSIFIFKNS